MTTWSAAARAASASGGGRGVGRHERHPADVARPPRPPTWPSTSPASASAFRTTGSVVAGSTRPAAPSRPAASSRPGHQVPGGVHQAGHDQVAEGVAGQLARSLEAVLEGPGQHRAESSARATRHLRRSPGRTMSSCSRRRPLEPPSSATDTTAVTSAGVAAGRPQGGRRAVAAADRHHPGAAGAAHRSMSRWKTEVATPWAGQPLRQRLGQHHRAVAPAGAAHGDRQVRLPLRARRPAAASRSRSSTWSRKARVSGWSST